jgi:5'-methylthioadenosine/S-adenosylhomocysteine nucleosidase
MSFNELDIISDETPQLKEEIDLIKEYFSSSNLRKGNIVHIGPIYFNTRIRKSALIKILDKGIKYNLFEKVVYYKCSKHNRVVGKLDNDSNTPFEAFCDLCGDEHIFNENDIEYSYKIKFDTGKEAIKGAEEVQTDKLENNNIKIDFGVITALSEELNAVKNLMDTVKEYNLGSHIYHFGIINSCSRNYNIVLVMTLNPGSNDSATTTTSLIHHWNPKYIIKIGIAGGYKDDVKLGDVVVSNQIFNYDYTKEYDDFSLIRPETYRTNSKLLSHVQNFEWKGCKDHNGNESKRIIGHLASGNQLIRSEKRWSTLRKYHDKICVLEMEGAGIATAAYQEEPPIGVMIISGISDYGDSVKNDDWHIYAAEAAAKYFTDLLKNGSID